MTESTTWRERAEAATGGPLVPDSAPTLVASEIGSYGFCPQAWYLERCGVPSGDEAERRLAEGSARHAAIGRRTDLIRAVGLARRCLLAAILVLVAILLVLGKVGG
jgi:hypothetical protein